ncbi:MAG: YybH family protein [Chitinophagaceae bacterium]
MKKSFTKLIVAAIAIFMVACNTASTDTKTAEATDTKDSPAFDLAAAKTAIEAENAKFMDAIKKGDSAGAAANYSDDAQMLPPDSEPVNKSGIATFWGSNIRMGVKDVKLVVDDIAGNAEIISETGHYEILAAENKLLDKGKYVVVWKPVNGVWKMYRDIFNTSMPAAPAK